LENFKSVFRRHVTSINNLPRKEKKVLTIGRTYPLFKGSSKSPPNSHGSWSMYVYVSSRIDMAIRYLLGGKHGKQTIIPIRHDLHMVT
jgi:hypothetical protein